MLPKQPPNDVEAEACVLGSLLVKNELFHPVSALLKPDDFYRHDHRQIYAAISEMIGAGKLCDFVTLAAHLRNVGQLDEIGGTSALADLLAGSSLSGCESYAGIVAEHAKRRRVIALCNDVGDAAYGGTKPDELLIRLTSEADAIAVSAQGTAASLGDAIGEALESAHAAQSRRASGGTLGVPTGLPALDNAIGGLLPGRLYGVAARPGIGKTALLNQIGIHAALRGHPGLIVSAEMTRAELAARSVANHVKINFTRFMRGHNQELIQAEAGLSDRKLQSLPLWLDTETIHLEGILARITEYKHKHGIEWAAVDHIGLLETGETQSRNDHIGKITRALKRATKRLNIGIIAVSQLNRGMEKENRRPKLSDLRDSGNIEQDLDVAIFLHSEEEQAAEERGVHLGILKNRMGMKGWMPQQFRFNGRTQTFFEIDARIYTNFTEPQSVAI